MKYKEEKAKLERKIMEQAEKINKLNQQEEMIKVNNS
jgi:hypothetical protein